MHFAPNSANVELVVKVGALALLVAAVSFGQGCFPQGKPVTIIGRLEPVDENGYRHWIAFRPARPICVLADPDDQYSPRVDDVDLIQPFNVDRAEIRFRLSRLGGQKAVLTGRLIQWHTGYQRAPITLEVEKVDALDDAGEAALRAPEPPKPVLREPPAYEVTIRAGRKLEKEAREAATNKLLTPTDEYAPHSMTGGDVLWARCRDGYELRSSSIAPKGAGLCGAPENTCCISSPISEQEAAVTLKMRCAKESPPPSSEK